MCNVICAFLDLEVDQRYFSIADKGLLFDGMITFTFARVSSALYHYTLIIMYIK